MNSTLAINHFLHGGDYNPDQWLEHPNVIDQDFADFKEAKINTTTLGIFSWAKLEPEEGSYDFEWLDQIFERVTKLDGHVILATPSGSRPRWLAEKYPEVLRVDEYGQRQRYGERHNHCYTSPIYRQKVQAINQKLAERYGQQKVMILWHISNELGGQCYCDLCQNAFREWLQAKYKTLSNLNHAYWNAFWSHTYTDWQQIEAPSPMGDQTVMGLNLDWRRFVTDQTINFYEAEIKPLRVITPEVPITTNFMGGNPPESHVFYDLDYQKFAKHVDLISWDSYPNWSNDYETTAHLAMKTALMNDMMRSLKHQNYLIMENTPSQVNWHPFNRAKRPGMHRMASLQEIAHGANSIMYFQLHQSLGASEMFHGAVVDQRNGKHSRVFEEVKQVGTDLIKLKPAIKSQRKTAQVAIVFDYDNMWALDDARNYANQTKCYWKTIQAHYQYFWDNDIPVEFISVEDDLTKYKLVIDPMHFMMASTYASKLAAYVKQGGHLVGTYLSGVVDQNFLAYQGGWPSELTSVYGVTVTETDTLYPKQHNRITVFGKTYQTRDYSDVLHVLKAQVLGNYQQAFYADTPAITKNDVGLGTAYYLACRTDTDFLADFYQHLIGNIQLTEQLPIIKNNARISIQVREDANRRYYFVINFSHSVGTIHLKTPLMNLLEESETQATDINLPGYGVCVFSEKI